MSLLFVPRPRPEQFENSPCHYEPQDDLEYVPLTSDALKRLAASLPQPISTVRYSNRENNYLFSDRESVYCPSLCSSPVSATSSTRVSMIHTPDEGTEEIAFDVAPISVPPERMAAPLRHAPAAKPIDKGALNFDSMFDIGGESTFARRNSTVEFLPEFDQIDDYIPDERTAARLEEERELERARLLYEQELEDDYPVTVARKPIMPTSLWMSQPRHIITPNFIESPKNTELTIPVSSSNIEASETSQYFPKTQTSFGSLDTNVSTATDLTVPSVGDDDYAEVDAEFVDTIFTYLSLNHGSMARKFDSELAIGSGLSLEKVQKDRKSALKAYIERYVFYNPEVSL
ncbi:hypothetical protein H072_1910 [Dactylellina haptotyla CBS 200.50]|uniref:Uncharacterized protein n=1 Tax=Dactylellina haptotyla (strain CBS 200.50) TaxID=1284197 RepID=S8C8Q5_DACHA|nr:hypothetical protein H072_1910 [Dactylellina haptotyla CBS 200.50]